MAKVEVEQLVKEQLVKQDTSAEQVEPANQLNLLSVAAIGLQRKGALTDAAQRYTVSQLLELPPKKLPHNFILQAESGAAPQAELYRLKSSYDKKYGVSLGWGAELSADTAKTTLAFSSEHSAQPEITKKQYEPTPPETKLAANDKPSECIKQVEQRIESEKLGLSPGDIVSQENRRMELVYGFDAQANFGRVNAIFEARTYGLDESLPAEEITKQSNHPAQKRWAEVLQLAPDASREQILQAQKEQIDKYAEGLTGQERRDAESALRTYWDAISVGLPNPELATAEQVNPLISELQRQEETIAMGLDPNSSWIEIRNQQEIREMRLSPDTSQEDIERIRRARELRLPDEATIEEVNELEANWNQRKEQLQQDCQI